MPSKDEDTLSAAEHELEDRARRDARSIRTALPALGRGLIAASLAAHGAATAALCAVVFTGYFPHPIMYLLMGLLTWLFLAIRFTAWVAGRRISAAALLGFNLLLTAFWCGILIDQIPGRVVFGDGLVEREATPALWVPVTLYVAAAVLMVIHAATRRSPR